MMAYKAAKKFFYKLTADRFHYRVKKWLVSPATEDHRG